MKTIELKFYDLNGRLQAIYDAHKDSRCFDLWKLYHLQVNFFHRVPSMSIMDVLGALFREEEENEK